jgi:hypothetical protein
MPNQKHQRAASSVEYVEMTDDNRNVLKRIVTGDKSWFSCNGGRKLVFMYDPETKLHQ